MQDIGRQKEIKELLAETDRRIEELRAVLADMDEIAALRRRRGEPESDDYNGFRRSDVLELLGRQQERRAALAAEVQRQNAEEAPKERTSLSAALEKLYEALSADVGRARRDVLQELKFYSRQTSAAYDELSLVIDALADRVAERVIERLGGAAFLAALPAGADAAQGEKSAFPANAPELISEEESAAEDISEQVPAAGEEEGAPSEAPQVTASEQAPAETAEAPAVNEEEAPAESSGEESTKAPAETAAVAEEAPAQEAGAESTEAPAETAETAEEDPAAQGEEVGGAQIREEEPAGPQGGAPEEK
ncbi:MAG TPA: hypothetical protein H9851_06155 [Candidatus Borkfalkia faecavium]|uniref:Uncharacterized protein n=1 Tax=Candidatus Borkfalkia faecavium TaxID=2838508 RepID=A0A9D2AVP2_9FIRM|nr:hypothetical protein [Candidatus Borkfalkia faecavium]